MNLPEVFLAEMKQLLGEEYEAWISSYDRPSFQGLRMNTYKTGRTDWDSVLEGLADAPVSWTENGFYCKEETRPAKDPYYYAGLYYLQEPSAMAPAAILPVKPGDAVLDLCAAPGGKSTELGARLSGTGLLVSNDISHSRAKALLKNLELFGISNLCVTSESPDRLADAFGPFFDSILVDAPCSGEGMFCKEPELIKSWLERGPEYYVPLQREILNQAVRMLKPGGYLLYSTCTFSRAENEENITRLLKEHSELHLCPVKTADGFAGGETGMIRLFPHKVKGEGHFLALLQKEEDPSFVLPPVFSYGKGSKNTRYLEQHTDFFQFESQLNVSFAKERLFVLEDQVYELPAVFREDWKLRYLRTGRWLGSLKKGRFEPSQALAMTLTASDVDNVLSLSHDDPAVIRYLKGETILLEKGPINGWCLVCVGRYPLGWAKGTGNTLKNKYYPGWRWQ